MSFPRAKLHRFNDIQNCTPSPADYNPVAKSRGPGSIKSTSERFPEQRVDNVSIISNDSLCFRTPTAIRKKKLLTHSAAKSKPTPLFSNNESEELKDKTVECNNKDIYIKELIDQIDDMKIQMKHLLEQKACLEQEKLQFEEAISTLEDQHTNEINKLMLDHKNEEKNIRKTIYEVELDLKKLREILELTKQQSKEVCSKIFKDMGELEAIFCITLKGYNEEIKLKDDTIREKLEQLEKLQKKYELMQTNHLEEVENLKIKQEFEIEDLQYEMLKCVTENQTKLENEKDIFSKHIAKLERQKNKEISNLKDQQNEEVSTLIKDKEAHIKQLEENYTEMRRLDEIQSQEKCKELEITWQLKLEKKEKESSSILKECQAISEYTIIQCELEKNELKRELSVMTKELTDLKNQEIVQIANNYEKLQTDYGFVITELEVAQNNLEKEIALREAEKTRALTDKYAYQVTISKTHEAIEAIKNRLLESDRDVEQLKSELEACEGSKVQLEDKICKLQEELDASTKLNEDLEIQQETTAKMVENGIKAIEKDMLQKQEDYKTIVAESIKKYEEKIKQNEEDLQEVVEHLHKQEDINSQAQNLIHLANVEINHLEICNGNFQNQIQSLQSELSEANINIVEIEKEQRRLKQQLHEEKDANEKLKEELRQGHVKTEGIEILTKQVYQLQEKSESYYQYCEYYKSKATEYESEIEDMNKINKNYIDQSKKYEDLLQRYEQLGEKNSKLEKRIAENESLIGPFREQLEAYEHERKILLSQKSNAENEAKEMSLKYAETLGHQNQKQKIKHLVDLKERNLELTKANQNMELKMNGQAKTIEKLRNELAMFTKSSKRISRSNKENVSSPSEKYIASPLRDRN